MGFLSLLGYPRGTVSIHRHLRVPERRSRVSSGTGLGNPLHGRLALQIFAFTAAAAVMLVSVVAPTASSDVAFSATGESDGDAATGRVSTDVAQSLSLNAAASLRPMGRESFEATEYVPPAPEPPASAPLGAPAAGVPDPGSAKAIAYEMVTARGWGAEQYDCLAALWQKESGWNVYAHNPSSGAYGIPQSLPGNKMASAGADWQTNPATQITWGLNYIGGRYGTPCGAWQHSQAKNWY